MRVYVFKAVTGTGCRNCRVNGHTPCAARGNRVKTLARLFALRARSVARRSTFIGAIAVLAHRTALAHGIHRVRSGAFLHGALLACREHTASPCVSHDCDFSACLSAVARRRRPVRLPPLYPHALHCPILRPRAGLPLSRAEGMRLSVRDELQSHTPHTRSPSYFRHAVGCCMPASRPFKRPSSFQPLVVPYLHAADLYTRLLFAG